MSAIIIGGGPAGAAAAIHLARAGHDVTLFERTSGPHDKVCGDFLSGPALAALSGLGIEPGHGVPIRRVRLIHGRHTVEAALPFRAIGLSRRVLDEALLEAARSAGARVRRGAAVRRLSHSQRRLRVEADSGEFESDTVLIATGKHDLRGAPRPGRGRGAIGLKAYLRLSAREHAALADSVELVLLPGGYAGLQSVEDGRAVLCVMQRRAGDFLAGGWAGLRDHLAAASPRLAQRLAGALPLSERLLAVAGVPYGHLHRPGRDGTPGLFRLGDQAAVIPSLAGDGVAIALTSAALAARTVREGKSVGDYHRKLERALSAPMRVAMLAHHLATAGTAQPWLFRLCRPWPGLIGLAAARMRCVSGLL